MHLFPISVSWYQGLNVLTGTPWSLICKFYSYQYVEFLINGSKHRFHRYGESICRHHATMECVTINISYKCYSEAIEINISTYASLTNYDAQQKTYYISHHECVIHTWQGVYPNFNLFKDLNMNCLAVKYGWKSFLQISFNFKKN